MPSETNSAKERQNVRNALSRALRALETPEEKLVRREIRNEKGRARRRRAKTKQKRLPGPRKRVGKLFVSLSQNLTKK